MPMHLMEAQGSLVLTSRPAPTSLCPSMHEGSCKGAECAGLADQDSSSCCVSFVSPGSSLSTLAYSNRTCNCSCCPPVSSGPYLAPPHHHRSKLTHLILRCPLHKYCRNLRYMKLLKLVNMKHSLTLCLVMHIGKVHNLPYPFFSPCHCASSLLLEDGSNTPTRSQAWTPVTSHFYHTIPSACIGRGLDFHALSQESG